MPDIGMAMSRNEEWQTKFEQTVQYMEQLKAENARLRQELQDMAADIEVWLDRFAALRPGTPVLPRTETMGDAIASRRAW